MASALTVETKERIVKQVKKALVEGLELVDACPYPWQGEEGRHFVATYVCLNKTQAEGMDSKQEVV